MEQAAAVPTSQTNVQPGPLATPTVFNPRAPTQVITMRELFGTKFTGGVIEMDYQLNTRQMQSLFRHYFKDVSQTFAAIDRYKTFSDLDNEALLATEGRISAQLDKVKGYIRKKGRETAALLELNGKAETRIKFPTPMLYRVPIISAPAREFMEAVVGSDEVTAQLETCHLLGLLDYRQKHAEDLKLRKLLRAVAALARSERIGMLKHFMALRTSATPDSNSEAMQEAAKAEVTALVQQVAIDGDLLGSVSEESHLSSIAKAMGVDASGAGDANSAVEPTTTSDVAERKAA